MGQGIDIGIGHLHLWVLLYSAFGFAFTFLLIPGACVLISPIGSQSHSQCQWYPVVPYPAVVIEVSGINPKQSQRYLYILNCLWLCLLPSFRENGLDSCSSQSTACVDVGRSRRPALGLGLALSLALGLGLRLAPAALPPR